MGKSLEIRMIIRRQLVKRVLEIFPFVVNTVGSNNSMKSLSK